MAIPARSSAGLSLVPPLRAAEGVAFAMLSVADTVLGSRVLYADETLARQSGYTLEQLRSHAALLLAGPRPAKAHVRAVIAALGIHPRRRLLAQQRKNRPDGTTYDVAVRIVPVIATDGSRQALFLQRELSR